MTDSPITAARREMEQAGWRSDMGSALKDCSILLRSREGQTHVGFWGTNPFDGESAWVVGRSGPPEYLCLLLPDPVAWKPLDTPDTSAVTRLIEYAEALEAKIKLFEDADGAWMGVARAATALINATDGMKDIRPSRLAVLDAMRVVLKARALLENTDG